MRKEIRMNMTISQLKETCTSFSLKIETNHTESNYDWHEKDGKIKDWFEKELNHFFEILKKGNSCFYYLEKYEVSDKGIIFYVVVFTSEEIVEGIIKQIKNDDNVEAVSFLPCGVKNSSEWDTSTVDGIEELRSMYT